MITNTAIVSECDEHLGCYEDKRNNRIFKSKHELIKGDKFKQSECRSLAMNKYPEATHYGIESNDECFVDSEHSFADIVHAKSYTKKSRGKCDDKTYGLGGHWKIDIYEIINCEGQCNYKTRKIALRFITHKPAHG